MCRLPDDSEFSLARVTFGKQHRFRYRNRWQDVLNSALPQGVRARFPPAIATITSPNTNEMVVWLWHRGVPGTGTPARYGLAVADEHGLEAPLHRPNVTCSVRPGVEINGWQFHEWPRRSKTLHLRIYGLAPTNLTRVAEFMISNPSGKLSPGWRPEPLPAIKRSNDLQLTLTQLETGLTGMELGFTPSYPVRKPLTHAHFEVKEAEAATGNWRVSAVTATSPWDENWRSGSGSSGWTNWVHGVDVDFLAALWLDEPAWKLRVEVTRAANFPANELWKINGVPVPKPKEMIEMHVVTNINGIEVEFTGVSGSNAFLNDRWYTGSPSYSNLHLRSPYPADNIHITVVDVVDDRGRHAESAGNSIVPSAGGRGITLKELIQGFALKIPEDAKTMDVTFAVTRSRYFEFLAKPVTADRLKAASK